MRHVRQGSFLPMLPMLAIAVTWSIATLSRTIPVPEGRLWFDLSIAGAVLLLGVLFVSGLLEARQVGAIFSAVICLFTAFLICTESTAMLWQVQLSALAVAFVFLSGLPRPRGLVYSAALLLFVFARVLYEVHVGLPLAAHTVFASVGGQAIVAAALIYHERRQRRYQEQLEREMSVKEVFLGQTSHELRTPISGIIGYAELLARSRQFDEEAVTGIQVCSQSAMMLISDILEWTRLRSESHNIELHQERFQLGELAEDLQMLAGALVAQQQCDVSWELHCEHPKAQLVADRKRLGQIVNGLVSNSCKFCHRGVIRCELKKLRGDIIEISVSDTGEGFSRHVQERLFDEFFKGGETGDGVGLGLSIAKALCRQMGGTLEGHSAGVGRGATFVLRVPTSDDGPNPTRVMPTRVAFEATVASTDQLVAQRKRTVLVVEDNSMLRRIVCRMIRNLGDFEVFQAEDGRDALGVLHELKNPDVVLVDVQMPYVSGLELARIIRGRERNRQQQNTLVPKRSTIVGISALTDSKDVTRALDSGMDRYLSKPLTSDKLASVLL